MCVFVFKTVCPDGIFIGQITIIIQAPSTSVSQLLQRDTSQKSTFSVWNTCCAPRGLKGRAEKFVVGFKSLTKDPIVTTFHRVVKHPWNFSNSSYRQLFLWMWMNARLPKDSAAEQHIWVDNRRCALCCRNGLTCFYEYFGTFFTPYASRYWTLLSVIWIQADSNLCSLRRKQQPFSRLKGESVFYSKDDSLTRNISSW